jgi:arginine decarboxylase
MKSYRELIEQTFEFPQKEFKVRDHELLFNDVPLMDIIKKYGTPLKLTYLPRISENIRFVQATFNSAMERFKYNGKYTYCYCTKSSHFSFIMQEALKKRRCPHGNILGLRHPHRAFLFEKGKISKDTHILCNGFKMPQYRQYISELLNDGFQNCVPILDNLGEIDFYEDNVKTPFKVGIRVAAGRRT